MDKIRHLSRGNYLTIGHDIDYFFRDCHDHIDFHEILFIVRGRALNVINGDMQVLKAQSVCFIRQDDCHYIKPFPDAKGDFEFFNIRVPVELYEKEFSKCSMIKSKILGSELPLILEMGRTEFAVMCVRLCEYCKIYEGDNKELTKYLYYSIVRSFLTTLISSDAVHTSKMPEWFVELINDLKLKNVANLSYEYILKKSNVEKSYLWKTFKKYLDISPTEYVNMLKLERACELIDDKSMSLMDIAMEVGYNNYSYFVRQFKKRYGYSPKKR